MKPNVAVVDFGTSKIVTAIAQKGALLHQKHGIEILGTGTVSYYGYQNGEFVDPEHLPARLSASIQAAQTEANMKITEAFVSVPAEFCTIRLADATLPVTDENGQITEELMDAVQDAAADVLELSSEEGAIIHRSPAWFNVDNHIKNTMQPQRAPDVISFLRKHETLQALTSFVIADDAFVRKMRTLFASLQIEILGFVSPALGEANLYIPPNERDVTACLVDVGYLSTEVSIIEGDAIVYQTVLPVGGGFLSADLAKELDINMATAEQIKRQYSFEPAAADTEYTVQIGTETYAYSAAEVAKGFALAMDETLEGINEAIEKSGALAEEAAVFLTGGGIASMPGAAGWLAQQLNRHVEVIKTESGKLSDGRFASVLGQIDLIFDAVDPASLQSNTLLRQAAHAGRDLYLKTMSRFKQSKEPDEQTPADAQTEPQTESQTEPQTEAQV